MYLIRNAEGLTRPEEYNLLLKDYILFLNLAHETYNISDKHKITKQITRVLLLLEKRKFKLTKSVLNSIKSYINILKTFDDSIIISEGKVLISIIR